MSYSENGPSNPPRQRARQSNALWWVLVAVVVVVVGGLAYGLSGNSLRTATTTSTSAPSTTGEGIARTPLQSTSPVATAPPSTTPLPAK